MELFAASGSRAEAATGAGYKDYDHLGFQKDVREFLGLILGLFRPSGPGRAEAATGAVYKYYYY